MIEQATEKQLRFIKKMESVLKEYFTGSTKQEASDWIDEHIDDFNEVQPSRGEWFGSHLWNHYE